MISEVLIITGPDGAGKTTLAEAFADSLSANCVHLSLDSFRAMVKAGFHDPRDGWNDEAQRQLDIARANVAAVAANYLISDFEVVIDDVVFPNWEPAGLQHWVEVFSPNEVKLIALILSWDVVVERNSARGERYRLPEKVLRTIYDDMSAWRERGDVLVIDNSELSVAETIAEMERLIRE